MEADDVVALWIFLLKKADPTIKTLEVSEDTVEDIHFSGFNRYIESSTHSEFEYDRKTENRIQYMYPNTVNKRS